jgi:hypothetical protein
MPRMLRCGQVPSLAGLNHFDSPPGTLPCLAFTYRRFAAGLLRPCFLSWRCATTKDATRYSLDGYSGSFFHPVNMETKLFQP